MATLKGEHFDGGEEPAAECDTRLDLIGNFYFVQVLYKTKRAVEMEISKIYNISFGKSPENSKNNKITFLETKKTEASSSEALESSGRASIINMPRRKRVPESIEEVCDHYIKRNLSTIEKYKTGEIRPLYDFVNPNETIYLYQKQNEYLEMMKELDDTRFLKRLNPNRDYTYTARNYTGTKELFKKNIEVLNTMDERLLPILEYPLLYAILETEDLQERTASLSLADDVFLENANKNAVMDYLCNTSVFSSTEETAKIMEALPKPDELPKDVLDDMLEGKLSLDVDGIKDKLGMKKAEIIKLNS
ncbi:MAG: hypothetical protein LUH05_01865 [Candidatus Gastranaerophilales bacterium]|nr:hypothetical protein [Candidatus Gastranaerophilales bacterium]